MGNQCCRTNEIVEIDEMSSSTETIYFIPPTSPLAAEAVKDDTKNGKLYSLALTALRLANHEAKVWHLYDAFGGVVDKVILDIGVKVAEQSGPGEENRAQALVRFTTENGLDESFIAGSFDEPSLSADKKHSIIELPDIRNKHMLKSLRNILSRPSHLIVDELARHIGDHIEHQVVARVYGSTVERTSDAEEQVILLAGRIEEMGLDGSFVLLARTTFECPVCFEAKSMSDAFEFMCGIHHPQDESPHIICYDCALTFVRTGVDNGDPNLKCFQCDHVVTPRELALIVGHGNERAGRHDPLYLEMDTLKRDHALGKDPAEYARCPATNCNWIVARSERGAADRADCAECGFSFCTNCLALYHYRTSCEERRRLNDEWRNWVVSGRVQYWQEDKEMHRKAETIARTERKRVESVLRTERQDEEWKAQNCRHCPHCTRIVNRLEGCSIMRCGYDTDTRANVQNGCLRRFIWHEAQPYVAHPVAGSRVKIEARSQVEAKTRHLYWYCAICNEEIVGLRFECVNCVSYTLCERCERDHWDNHADAHFFRIHQRADT